MNLVLSLLSCLEIIGPLIILVPSSKFKRGVLKSPIIIHSYSSNGDSFFHQNFINREVYLIN